MSAELKKRIMALDPPGIEWEVDLSRLCTMRVGGPALATIRPRSRKEAREILPALSREGIPWRAIGRGSNLLAADTGYHGALVVMGREMGDIEILDEEKVRLRAEAGCSLARLLHLAVDHGFAGLEFAAGIPGSVGGAVVMNAGSGGVETADVLQEVEWLDADGVVHRDRSEALGFSYRAWGGEPGAVVLSATFDLRRGEPGMIREEIRSRLRSRGKSQPVGEPSFGSVFKNPPGDYAGRLIEAAGLKGLSRGDARISEKHANFIVNRGRAKAADILWIMHTVRDTVAERFGVSLEPEVHLLEDDTQPLWEKGGQ